MIPDRLTRRLAATGWSTIGLGVVCLLLALLDLVVPPLLTRLAAALGDGDESSRLLQESFSAGAGISASVNAAFGAALVAIGYGVTRRSRWAHRALEIACWASIVAIIALSKPMLAPIYAFFGSDAKGRSLLIAAVVLVAAQIVAVLWFLRFWRREEVRDAFR